MKKQHTSLVSLLLLLLGAAFMAQSVDVGPFTFNAVRSLMGAIVLLPVLGRDHVLCYYSGSASCKGLLSQNEKNKSALRQTYIFPPIFK